MPQLKLRMYQLERLMQIYVPDVYATLLSKEVPCEVFSIQWYVTLFSHDFEPSLLSVVWDLFLLRKWRFLFQLSLSILRQLAPKVEELEYDELVVYLRTAVEKGLIDKEKAIRDALDIKIPKEMLRLLKTEYAHNRSDSSTPTSQGDQQQPFRVSEAELHTYTRGTFKSATTHTSSTKVTAGTDAELVQPYPEVLILPHSSAAAAYLNSAKRRCSEAGKPMQHFVHVQTHKDSQFGPNHSVDISPPKGGKSELSHRSVIQAVGDAGSPACATSPANGDGRSPTEAVHPRAFEPPKFHPRNDPPASYATVGAAKKGAGQHKTVKVALKHRDNEDGDEESQWQQSKQLSPI